MKLAYVIDKSIGLAQTVHSTLLDLGYKSMLLENEAAVIRAFLKREPDVAILNFGIEGDALYNTAVQMLGDFPSTRVVVMTSLGTDAPNPRPGNTNFHVLKLLFTLENFEKAVGYVRYSLN
jgi:hypothetical protein